MTALDRVTDNDMLTRLKSVLGVSGSFHDDALMIIINEVKAYLISAGCSDAAVDGEAAVGCVIRGVADLWNLGSGTVGLSPYFKERAAQLALSYPRGENDVQT